MKPFSRFSAVLFALVVAQAAVSRGLAESYGIAAIVNGRPITRSEVRDVVESQEQMIRMTIKDADEARRRLLELHDRALDALIERQLVLSEFEKMGGVIKPEYVDDEIRRIILENFNGDRDKFIVELTKTGMTMKKFREMQEKLIIVQFMKQQQLRGMPPPTPAEVSAFYSKNAEKFRDKDFIKISTITIPKYPVGGDAGLTPESQKKLTEELRTELLGGADFAGKARHYSQDSHADQGGEWDWIERSQMDPGVAETAFALKPGALSKVMDVGPSYMIILCNAKRPGPSVPFNKVRPDIEKIIKSEKGREALNGWLTALARKSTIQPENVRGSFMRHLQRELE